MEELPQRSQDIVAAQFENAGRPCSGHRFSSAVFSTSLWLYHFSAAAYSPGHSPSALPAIAEDNAFALEMSVPRSKHSYYWQGLIKVPRGPRRMDCAGPYGDMHVKFAISVYILHTGTFKSFK